MLDTKTKTLKNIDIRHFPVVAVFVVVVSVLSVLSKHSMTGECVN